jgi:hypothetical protein
VSPRILPSPADLGKREDGKKGHSLETQSPTRWNLSTGPNWRPGEELNEELLAAWTSSITCVNFIEMRILFWDVEMEMLK